MPPDVLEPISDLEFTTEFDAHKAPTLVVIGELSTRTGETVFGHPVTRRGVVACRIAASGTHTHWRYPTEEPPA